MPPREPGHDPLRIAIVNDYEVVVRGVRSLLEPYSERIVVVELDADVTVSQPVDLALYDNFSMEGLDGVDLDDILASHLVPRVALYTWHLDAETIANAGRRGVAGVLSKSLDAGELVDALERIHGGERIVSTEPAGPTAFDKGDWPGRGAGLTARESEVVALIAQGLSNDDIARRTQLSINTVKSYIRTAYRRMDVYTRSEAVLWALDHGFEGRRSRIRLAAPPAAVTKD